VYVIVHEAVVIDENAEHEFVGEKQKVEHALDQGTLEKEVAVVAASGEMDCSGTASQNISSCRAGHEKQPMQSPCPQKRNL
jgi:hypothetical protein